MESAKSHKGKNKLKQPSSSFADCAEESTDKDVGKDFHILMNRPLSKGGHFVFKSEKTWSVDSSQFSEFFTLNLKTLSAAISCIPFNECIDLDDKYFTSDQLTSICNEVKKAKAAYMSYKKQNLSNACSDTDTSEDLTLTDQSNKMEPAADTRLQSESNIDELDEDIDFLISLKEPVQNGGTTFAQPISVSHSNDSKLKPKDASSKPIDLEKWLDSVLDD